MLYVAYKTLSQNFIEDLEYYGDRKHAKVGIIGITKDDILYMENANNFSNNQDFIGHLWFCIHDAFQSGNIPAENGAFAIQHLNFPDN